jgi:hypothetical protein
MALHSREIRALIAHMKTHTTNAISGAPGTLYMDQGGRIECLEHAPYRGSDSWVFGDWRPITPREAVAFEREVGRPTQCETCAAIARRSV